MVMVNVGGNVRIYEVCMCTLYLEGYFFFILCECRSRSHLLVTKAMKTTEAQPISSVQKLFSICLQGKLDAIQDINM